MADAEFVRLVKDMRAAQRRYFRERTPQALEESKRLEREVDAAVKAAGDDQGKLDFGGPLA